MSNDKNHDTSLGAQRARVLKALEQEGARGLTTIQMRENLDYMSPAPRVLELRRQGLDIRTIWTVSENAQGRSHRNARYVLISQSAGVAA